MKEVVFIPNDNGAFDIDENSERIAEMIVGISGNEISVYHRCSGKTSGTRY